MQLVGFQSWEQNPTAETITLEDVRFGAALARRNFTERVLDATYYDLSPNDVRFLQAMLDDERESRTTDIASRLGETTNYASTYKRRLIKRGIIGERGTYFVAFELPGFRDYLMEKCGPFADVFCGSAAPVLGRAHPLFGQISPKCCNDFGAITALRRKTVRLYSTSEKNDRMPTALRRNLSRMPLPFSDERRKGTTTL